MFRNDTFYMEVERHWRNVESYDYNEATAQVDRAFYLEILHEQEQLGNRSDFLFDLDIASMHNIKGVNIKGVNIKGDVLNYFGAFCSENIRYDPFNSDSVNHDTCIKCLLICYPSNNRLYLFEKTL